MQVEAITFMRIIFGALVTQTTILKITGTPLSEGAPIYRAWRQATDPEAWEGFPCADDEWEFELAAGEYIFRLENADADGPITVTSDLGFTVVTIPAPAEKHEDVVAGAVGDTDEIVTSNPKDPWPPPPPPPPSEMSSTARTWFNDMLLPYANSISRGAADYPDLAPADALGA